MISPHQAASSFIRIQEERIDQKLLTHDWSLGPKELKVSGPIHSSLLEGYRNQGWVVTKAEDDCGSNSSSSGGGDGGTYIFKIPSLAIE